jgi:formylglycine-generating enzyme required for sulfatase activity
VPAGKFAPNDFGLYNMAGNVNEWVTDQYISRGNINKIDSVEVLDAFLPDYHRYNDSRVYKGGSWKDPVYWLHPASRRYLDKSASANDIGFRCAMSMVPGTR